MVKGRLLLVDDQPELLRLMSTYLPRAGYEVRCCETAGAALAEISANPTAYDGAIVDLGLPDMDGRDLVSLLARDYPHLRILVASGAYLDLDSFGELAHPIRLLQKPYVPKTLIAALEELLAS